MRADSAEENDENPDAAVTVDTSVEPVTNQTSVNLNDATALTASSSAADGNVSPSNTVGSTSPSDLNLGPRYVGVRCPTCRAPVHTAMRVRQVSADGVSAVGEELRLVVAKNLSFDRVNVYEIMRKPVLTLHPGTDIRHAINIINRFKISRAVVLDDARTLLGIVTLRDMVLRYAVAREGGE